MPDWHTNVLEFGSYEDARKVWDGMMWHNKKFSFKAVMPHPERKDCEPDFIFGTPEHASHFKKDVIDFVYRAPGKSKPWLNVQEWHCAHWGCKNDAFYPKLCRYYDEYIHIEFLTANAPVKDEFLQKLANQFDVSFTFEAFAEEEDYSWYNSEPKIYPIKQFEPK